MRLKSSWPGKEHGTPINSQAISAFTTHNPVVYRSTFVYEDDFRVRINSFNDIFGRIEDSINKGNGKELTKGIKALKEYFESSFILDDLAFCKIVDVIVYRLNHLSSASNTNRIMRLKETFKKKLAKHHHPSVKEKAFKIT